MIRTDSATETTRKVPTAGTTACAKVSSLGGENEGQARQIPIKPGQVTYLLTGPVGFGSGARFTSGAGSLGFGSGGAFGAST